MKKTALISDCQQYRYTLTREWGDGPRAIFVLLNPSKADSELDDMSVTKGIGFATDLGCGSLLYLNLFALRSTDPAALLLHKDPVGPRNDRVIKDLLFDKGVVIAAWGSHTSEINQLIQGRLQLLRKALGFRELWCLGTTKDGSPRHPSRLAYATELEPFGL